MSYIPRRIQITIQSGETETISDSEFAQIDAPLVLLGEPGAGKSETAQNICTIRAGTFIRADRLASGSPVPELSECIPVIDGLDEVQSNNSESPLISILKRLEERGIRSFVLTCRAADWANVQNERAVENWFGRKPVVGHLQPLDNDEIESIVDGIGSYSSGGKDFVHQASQRNAIDLARNPQSLKLLLAAISESDWPTTKTELFEVACENFAKEHNSMHRSLTPHRASSDILLSTAGFICAQLLLSGQRGINVDGQEGEISPRLIDLTYDSMDEELVRTAVSTLLFRPSGTDSVEPVHRTVAEFLGAKWLAETLRANTLSIRRLKTLFYSQGTVPGPLRGTHAWLATLNRNLTDQFVSHDPYGCLRYGDVSQYSVEQVRHLMTQLQSLADIDPYFRSEDWTAQIGSGLARPELRDVIVGLIQNPDVQYQLSCVVLESLAGTDLASSIQGDIRDVILAEEMTYVTRDRALEVLNTNNGSESWTQLANLLIAKNTHASARLAVNIAVDHIDSFEGEDVARIVILYDRINEEQPRSVSLGIGFRLFDKMSLTQLRDAIPGIVIEVPEEKYERNSFEQTMETRLLEALQKYLENGGEACAEEILSWLANITDHHYHKREWDKFNFDYFRKQTGLRHEIQTLVFDKLAEGERNLLNYSLQQMANGLRLDENDVAFHLDSLLEREQELTDFVVRWRNLVELILGARETTGVAENVARAHAATRPYLQSIIVEIENRPAPQWKTDQEQRRQQQAEVERQRTESRHRTFNNIEETVRSGQNLGALKDISNAYLGFYSDLHSIENPMDRVEEYVGKQNVAAALQGLQAALHRDNLPTPREIAKLRTEESKEFHLEQIILVGCLLEFASGRDLGALRGETLLCALVACHWGMHSHGNSKIKVLEDTLTQILFISSGKMESFVRDTLEPDLFAGAEHVSGLYEVTTGDRYSGLVASLALEWLERSDSISTQVLRNLLGTALIHSDRIALSDLINEKLEANNWPNEEHRYSWLGAAFKADFERFEGYVQTFSSEEPNTLTTLGREEVIERRSVSEPLTVDQLSFLISTYAICYPNIDPPIQGWGTNDPYESARFINDCITSLGEKNSKEAQGSLELLVSEHQLGNHHDHALHVLSEHTRAMAEASWANHTFQDVRQILLSAEPQSIDDLQGLVIDELDALQQRLKDGSFNGVLPYWNEKIPQLENYCRDRVAEQLEPYLGRFNVRVHTEGTMANNNRCDLLCTIGETDLPIEIKGQWHPNVWTAACDQLEDNYSSHYRADGRGVYLVLWFGNISGSNPPGIRENGRPEGAQEMLGAISERSPRDISSKTKLFVLDLSKPS